MIHDSWPSDNVNKGSVHLQNLECIEETKRKILPYTIMALLALPLVPPL